jgi:hypothetical protein
MSFAVIAASVGRGAQYRGPSSGQAIGDPSLGGAELVPGTAVVAGTMLPLHAATIMTNGSALRDTSDSSTRVALRIR